MPENKDGKKTPDSEDVGTATGKELLELRGKYTALAGQKEQLEARAKELEKDVKYKDERIAALEKKLKAAKSAPTGDVVYIDGKTWTVKGTVRASDALDHVKKGYLEEDVSLIITDRRE